MPGNEFGEKIHNFFGQQGLSQDQNQSQVVDGSWSNYNNGHQRQIDPSLIANLKSYNTKQSVDHESGHQSSNSHHGLNYTQQPIRSEFSRSLLQEHQQLPNGYTHGNLGLQTMPNGANFLGVDVESSRDRLSARGFTPELHKIPMRLEMGESPVNYDFFGGQQQSNTQLPGMLQPLPRQQMTFNDMQLLKQQAMVKQMHEYQMQQQLQKQQLGARQLISLNINAVNGSRSSDNQSHMINGIPLQNASSNWLRPDLMTGNTNWMHRGISPVVQGSSSGLMITPEHGQSNLMAQQFGPSLYGMPVSGTNAPQNAFSSVQMNRLAAPHGSANRSYSLTNQPTSFLNQGGVQDSQMLPRSTYQEKALFSQTSVPDSNNRPSFENFQQDDSRERNISAQEKFCQMEDSGPSEKSFMKVPENINALQKSSTLDPTEEKILFGSDDNLWDAFGSSTDMSLQGNLMSSSSDLFDACPSLQSGSWSALMQSAVAETSSDDAGVHGWVNNNTVPHANSHTDSRAHSDSKTSNALSERFHSDSTRAAVQHLPDKGNKFSDHGQLEKPMAQPSQMAGNIFHSSSIDEQNNLCSVRQNEGIEDRFGIWKAASNPNVAALIEQKNHFTQNPQRASYGFGIASAENGSSASRDVQGNIQQHFDNNSVEKAIPQLKSRDGSQILESYASDNAGTNEMVNARDFSMLPGRKDTQYGHVGSRRSISRKFQYHPMGNIDVTNESCQEKVSHLPPTLEQVSVGNQGYFGQPKFLGQSAMNMPIDRGHVSQNDLNCTNEAFNGMGSENSPSTSASADRSVDRCNQVKSASSRQTMLELLHKVDQSPENSSETNISGIHAASAGPDQQISPQMAPSWYSQYGTFKNGLVLPMNDTGRFTPLKIGEQSSNVESSVDGTHTVQSSKQCNMQQMSGSAPGVETPSSESLLHGATDKLLNVDKPKKRKTATSKLQSWNKEVTQDSQRLKTLSETEINWARATNRFAEKVEFETLLEDGPPIRSKRRLIHTTQLMQELFSPPPAGVISLAASSNYEFVAYTAARGALGDACSSSCIDRSERFLPPNNSNPLSETTKTEKISDQYISKAAEDFISRTRKLETDFAGLENGTTIPDLRVEVQDLEKFAVINRFAKFHPPSSSMDRTLNSLRLNPQRYVTVAPMPRNIPDRLVGILRTVKPSVVKKREILY
ncbi:unnamed protein product [Arabidopsis arenosa]|uniref:Uncharacterized protein n=1 Tax=Arabidopsis arenosa TaxID=38785 RepID=A0A8S2AHD1_ARAAE|nr:unnamed protein product [Arabidopsis arenosa]